MQVTRATLAMMLFLSGCAGCGSCERAETAPGRRAAPTSTAVGLRPAVATPGKIQAGAAPTAAPRELPTSRPPVPGATPPAAAPAAPGLPQAQAPPPAPEGGDEDDCIVVADANPDYGPPPLAVTFSAEAECSAGQPTYKWDFGDGSPASTEANPAHTYAKPGDYTASVTVTGPAPGAATASDEIAIR